VEVPEEEIIHEDNEWGISLVGDAEDEDDIVELPQNGVENNNLELVEGVTIAYEKKKPQIQEEINDEEDDDDGQSLEELMRQMQKL